MVTTERGVGVYAQVEDHVGTPEDVERADAAAAEPASTVDLTKRPAAAPGTQGPARTLDMTAARPPITLRADFGAHLEVNYQRLVAQLYAITLDPGEAHEAVQDAYSRAWRSWAEIGAGPDPTAWVRRVAVRTTQRSWRRHLQRLGLGRPRPVGDGDPRTAALLGALARLPAGERRVVVLYHMVGMSLGDIAALEQTGVAAVRDRLTRAHLVVTEGLADELPSVLGAPDDGYRHDAPHDHAGYGTAYDDERLR